MKREFIYGRNKGMEDKDIVNLYWARDERAITESDLKYGKYCRSIARNILKNEQDTEECINDTFLSAWNSMPKNRPEHLLPYLGRITRNLALDKYDYKKAKKRNNEFDILLSELEECLADTKGIEEHLEMKELSGAINTFLKELPQEKRILFVRRYWYSDSVAELSRRFDMSESKVKMLLFRTRKALKKHLEKEGIHV
ncbi:MAG: sigma-70 family RNA polymerase sigma factor [Eubacteriales bacterium]|nr:sigma-70 family RNA polymerase sigma factor [Eubacteriales bacterium]